MENLINYITIIINLLLDGRQVRKLPFAPQMGSLAVAEPELLKLLMSSLLSSPSPQHGPSHAQPWHRELHSIQVYALPAELLAKSSLQDSESEGLCTECSSGPLQLRSTKKEAQGGKSPF